MYTSRFASISGVHLLLDAELFQSPEKVSKF